MARPGRIVIVSARAPFVSRPGGKQPAPGGVVSALLPTMRRTGGLWIAAGTDQDAADDAEPSFDVRSISLPRELRHRWYARACNGAVWPLAHGLVERCRFRSTDWRAYRDVNTAVAEHVANAAEPGGSVWVHDYQLALVPSLLRARRHDLKIGFFWHIPWPPAELLRLAPWWEALVQGILGADVIGLHVPRYVRAFGDALEELGVDVHGSREIVVPMGARSATVVARPIGIDLSAWTRLATDGSVVADAAALRRALVTPRILLAVDRLDYSKGVVERLEAFDRALAQAPSLHGSVTLVQIGVPTRESLDEYRRLRERVEAMVGQVNGKVSTPSWTPVRFFATCLSPRELAPYYVAADAALITPLRDGMNLVALEFVAAARRRARILLSTTAGAADVLPDAHLVNPYDEDALADAIVRMAAPPSASDELRMRALKARVAAMDVDGWVDAFLDDLETGTATQPAALTGRDGEPISGVVETNDAPADVADITPLSRRRAVM